MKIKKSIALLMVLGSLVSCVTLEDVISQKPSDEEPTSIFDSVTSEEDPTSIIDSISDGEGTSESDVKPADLTNFSTDIINDPVITYTEADYTVKPFKNGFTYPLDAQVQPTNAYLEFWHQESLLSFHIVASKQVFSLIEFHGYHDQKNADLYWPVTVDVTMNGKRFTYYEVGMRMKGNTSRKQFLDSGTKEFINSVSFKLSFNELWDDPLYAPFNLQKTWTEAANPEWKVRDDRTFMGNESGKLGMKKLDFKWNKSRDSSLVMQPYAFGFFQKHGLISQNSTLTTLKLNNTRMGIVTVNEPVDKHLLRRYFPKAAAAGDLYKVGWDDSNMGNLRYENYLEKNTIIGEEDKFNYYTPIYDAKEFDDTLPNPHEKLINLMRVLQENEGKSIAEFSVALEAIVDIDSFLSYAALSYLAGNPDDMRNWGNNYYIFFNPSNGNKATFIPYDYDWSFGLTWNIGNISMLDVSPYSTKHQLDRTKWQSNRLYWYTIVESTDGARPYPNISLNPAYKATYSANLTAYNNDPYYTVANYDSYFNTYKGVYGDLTVSDLDNKVYENDVNLGPISPFIDTYLMTRFINNTKQTLIANSL